MVARQGFPRLGRPPVRRPCIRPAILLVVASVLATFVAQLWSCCFSAQHALRTQLLPAGPCRGSSCRNDAIGGPGSPRWLQTRHAVSGQQELGKTAAVPPSSGREEEQRKAKLNADELQWETQKFNLMWTKMTEAKEQGSPKYAELKEQLEVQGKIVTELGGSLPADMLTQEQAAENIERLKADLNAEKLFQMTNEERWTLAQGLGPAFPVSLVLSYTLYWVLNVPFIAYAYFTTVVTGQTTMPVVMAAAYATSIPFKPLIYIGGLLGTVWTSDNIMPLLAKFFSYFRLPDADDWDRL